MTPPRALSAPHATPLDLGGRTALVTGAAGGIGRACVLRLAAAGAKVRAVDRDAAGLEALAEAARD
ncbi:3-hydroxybutyrate dehydrogenase, partial [Streptomyces sp. 13-12-16]|uniref:SDR family NAD(P)-dependent oxidoreductase n=1 Tax=Streptomyces sp. 13-12-16 TaxID=1570823 RepID=UPI000A24E905